MAWSSENGSLSLHLMKNTVRMGASEAPYEKERILGRGSTRVISNFFFSLNRYLDSNGLLQNLLFFFLFFISVFILVFCLLCCTGSDAVIPDYAAGVNGQKSLEVN